MADVPEVVTLYEPATAAEKLSVSASGLRRLAPIYEAVFDELPRTGKGQKDKRSRLWPVEAVERLQVARGLVEVERFKTIQAALEALRNGLTVDADELTIETPQAPPDKATQAALQVLLEEVRQLRLEVRQLKENHASLEQLEQNSPLAKDEIKDACRYGLLVRAAMWVESIFKRV